MSGEAPVSYFRVSMNDLPSTRPNNRESRSPTQTKFRTGPEHQSRSIFDKLRGGEKEVSH